MTTAPAPDQAPSPSPAAPRRGIDRAALTRRLVYGALTLAIVAPVVMWMRWDWLPDYIDLFLAGIWTTIWLTLASAGIGLMLAVPIGLVQVTGPWPLAALARGFCTVIRGTPLLVQMWMLYFGLGELFQHYPWIRETFLWESLRAGWPYALLALTLSYAGYEGEVMRGAFASVPRGELEAGRAFGMSPFTLLRRIWLPRAFFQALPTLAGETVLQLKATPLVATIAVIDVYAIATRVRQDTYVVYEPLLLIAVLYMLMTLVLVRAFGWLEARVPVKRA